MISFDLFLEKSASGLSLKRSYNQPFDTIQDALEYAEHFKPILEMELERITKQKGSDFLIDIKSEKSILSKLNRKASPISKMKDILRSTILVNNHKDVKSMANRILMMYSGDVVEIDTDAYENPKEGNPYYGTIHVILKLVDGSMEMACEIIIMTKTMHGYKEKAHKFYSKVRDDSSDKKMANYANDRMSKLFQYGNQVKQKTDKSTMLKNRYAYYEWLKK